MNIREFSEKSIRNKKNIESSLICGCYFCVSIFNSKDIKDWADEGETAICPLCGIDAIVPDEKDVSLTKEYLQKIHDLGFGEEKIRKHGQ